MRYQYSQDHGSRVFVFGSDPEGDRRGSVCSLRLEDVQTIADLLSVGSREEVGVRTFGTLGNEPAYLMLYDNRQTPCPGVIVAKCTVGDGCLEMLDMEEADRPRAEQLRAGVLPARDPVIPLTMNRHWDGTDASLLTRLGTAYEEGTLFQQDYGAALTLYRIAGAADPQAICHYGRMAEHGLGMDRDMDLAVHCYHQAAEQGCVAAMSRLGTIYEEGILGPPDYEQCAKWYQRAAVAGDQKALFRYAVCLYQGYGTDRDYEKALSLFRQLEGEGVPDACCYVGRAYEDGLGVEQDYEQALEHYRRGSQAGSGPCWSRLGALYARGLGVEQDLFSALNFYFMAALSGESGAYCSIAKLYESGALGEPNPDKAAGYYKIAAAEGAAGAQEALQRLGGPPEEQP